MNLYRICSCLSPYCPAWIWHSVFAHSSAYQCVALDVDQVVFLTVPVAVKAVVVAILVAQLWPPLELVKNKRFGDLGHVPLYKKTLFRDDKINKVKQNEMITFINMIGRLSKGSVVYMTHSVIYIRGNLMSLGYQTRDLFSSEPSW
ncbi:hypothetical protein HanIR_Chr17g0882591 [Helianthus annuus]|nr:hypothetical protein HanIR_Chr17g0882591 [Helianthus annuus]